mgnify:CR=1 FL=1
MEEKKQPTGAEEHNTPEAPVADGPGTTPAQPAPGDVVVPFEKIEELMAEQRAAARHAVEQAEPLTPEAPTPSQPEKATEQAPEEKPQEEVAAEQKKPRRGRPPKAEKTEQAAPKADKEQTAAKPRRGRPPKADKAAPDEAQPPKPRDKVSRGKKAAPAKEESPAPEPVAVGGDTAPAAEIPAEPKEPAPPPRPIEEGKTVYIKLSELHPFHTFREHPFKVVDDAAMMDLVGTIKEHGVMTPATVRPEKDGNGYEIIAGHRRCHGGERAGLDEIPCIVREMTDLEAVREMKNSNKQRGDPLPSELAKLLDLELEAIKRQGARPKNDKEAEALGKLSVEIVGKEHDMNYKKVLRYVRLNHLVPELLEKVDAKNMGFMPAVELSYIKPENQRLIAVSIDGEQSSPSVKQAKRLRELDQEGLLNGDVIDGILSEEKREVDNVIISTDELNKYFGKEVTPAKMKEQIMALLDEWKEKQPPELAKPEKKHELDK